MIRKDFIKRKISLQLDRRSEGSFKNMKRENKKIKKIADHIVKEYKPEKIYLFGSYAWGKPTRDSDFDLMIIKKTKENFDKRVLRVIQIIDGEVAADVLVRTPEEVRKRLKMGDFFYQNIINKGKILYEASK